MQIHPRLAVPTVVGGPDQAHRAVGFVEDLAGDALDVLGGDGIDGLELVKELAPVPQDHLGPDIISVDSLIANLA